MLAARPGAQTHSRPRLRGTKRRGQAMADWIETQITAKVSPRSVTEYVRA